MPDLKLGYIDTSSNMPAGLQKSRKMIRAQRDREIQFLKLCTMIKIDDFKQSRAERQKQDRIQKRQK